jgi:hypothetical protein
MNKHVLAALALCAGGTAMAQQGQVTGFVGMALTGGGDTLVHVTYTNGDTKDIKAGGLVDIKGGFEYRQQGSPVAIQGSIGYHTDTTSASNGHVRFDRIPLELLGFYSLKDNVRLGGGLRYAANAHLSSSGAAASVGSFDLHSRLGLVLEGEYLFTPHFGLGLRAVSEKYELPGGGPTVDGSHVGVRFSYYF